MRIGPWQLSTELFSDDTNEQVETRLTSCRAMLGSNLMPTLRALATHSPDAARVESFVCRVADAAADRDPVDPLPGLVIVPAPARWPAGPADVVRLPSLYVPKGAPDLTVWADAFARLARELLAPRVVVRAMLDGQHQVDALWRYTAVVVPADADVVLTGVDGRRSRSVTSSAVVVHDGHWCCDVAWRDEGDTDSARCSSPSVAIAQRDCCSVVAQLPLSDARPRELSADIYDARGSFRVGGYGNCTTLIQYFRGKRAGVLTAARAEKASVPRGVPVVLERPVDDVADHLVGDLVVLDIGSNVRHIVASPADIEWVLSSFVRPACSSGIAGPTTVALLRDFLQGDLSVLVERVDGGDGLHLELASSSLMALTRGSVATTSAVVPSGVVEAHPRLPSHLRRAGRTMVTASRKLLSDGAFQLEWTLRRDAAYLVDLSRRTCESGPTEWSRDRNIICPGSATGPVLDLTDDEILEALSTSALVSLDLSFTADAVPEHLRSTIATASSNKPIVFARRPFASLAPLIPYAAGFVFEGGGLLAHLCILLREHRIPAIVVHRSLSVMDQASIIEGKLFSVKPPRLPEVTL